MASFIIWFDIGSDHIKKEGKSWRRRKDRVRSFFWSLCWLSFNVLISDAELKKWFPSVSARLVNTYYFPFCYIRFNRGGSTLDIFRVFDQSFFVCVCVLCVREVDILWCLAVDQPTMALLCWEFRGFLFLSKNHNYYLFFLFIVASTAV